MLARSDKNVSQYIFETLTGLYKYLGFQYKKIRMWDKFFFPPSEKSFSSNAWPNGDFRSCFER